MTSLPQLLLATRNRGKLRELADLLGDIPFELVSLDDVGIAVDVEETGATFEENAILKAETYRDLSGMLTLADDSGLEVDALDGQPGVRSARYAGPDASDSDRIRLILSNLASSVTPECASYQVRDRLWTARFRCVIAVAAPGRQTRLYSGVCEGRIVHEPRGDNGFGYDPVFLFPDLCLTMAELTAEQKNAVSHRAMAVREVVAAFSRSEWRGVRNKSLPRPPQ